MHSRSHNIHPTPYPEKTNGSMADQIVVTSRTHTISHQTTYQRITVSRRSTLPRRAPIFASGLELCLKQLRNIAHHQARNSIPHATQTHKHSRSHNAHPILHTCIPKYFTPDRLTVANRTHTISHRHSKQRMTGAEDLRFLSERSVSF